MGFKEFSSNDSLPTLDATKVAITCTHRKWENCDCEQQQTAINIYEAVLQELNNLAGGLDKMRYHLGHERTCAISEMGMCSCSSLTYHSSVHALFGELAKKLEELKPYLIKDTSI